MISVSGLVDDRENSLIIIIISNNFLILLFTNIIILKYQLYNKVAMHQIGQLKSAKNYQCKVDQKIPMTIFVTGPSLALHSAH